MVLPVNPPLDSHAVTVSATETKESSSQSSIASPWPALVLSLVLIFLASFPLINHWNFQFVGPDMVTIASGVRGGADASPWKRIALSLTQSLQPVTEITFAIQNSMNLLNARTVQCMNVGFHLVTTLLVFLALCVAYRRLELSTGIPRGGELLAFVTALLWSVHPLTSETVSFASNRAELLASLFSAGMLLFHLIGWWGYRWSSLLAVLCFGLGSLSKPVVLLMPIVILVVEYGVSTESLLHILKRRQSVLSCYAGIIASILGLHFATGAYSQSEDPALTWGYLNAQTDVIGSYLIDSVIPSGLCPDYRWPVVEAAGPSIATIVMLIVSLALVVSPYFLRRTGTMFAVFIWLLLPRCLMETSDAYAEYRMYLPLVVLVAGIAIAGQALFDLLFKSFKAAPAIARLTMLGIVLLVFGIESSSSYAEHQKFADKKKFWKAVVTATRTNPDAYSAIGFMAYEDKELDYAVIAWDDAIKASKPDDPKVGNYHLNIAQILETRGGAKLAIEQYLAAEKTGSFSPEDQLKLSQRLQRLYVATDQFDAAREQLDKQLVIARSSPQFDQAQADKTLAVFNIEYAESLIARNEQLDLAARLLDDITNAHPRLLKAFLIKAKLKQVQGEMNQALAIYDEVLAKTPQEVQARYGRTFPLMMTGRQKEAISELVMLVNEYPKMMDFKRQLAWYLATVPIDDLRNSATAVEFAKEVCNAQRKKGADGVEGKIDPFALNTLAAALASDGQFELAVNSADAAITRAQELNLTAFAKAISERRELYRQQKPYIEKLTPSTSAGDATTPAVPTTVE